MIRSRLFLITAVTPLLALADTSVAPETAAPDPAEALIREAALHSPLMLEQELQIAQADAFRFRGWRQYMPYISANYQAGYFQLLSAADPNAKEGQGRFGGSYTLSAYHPLYQWGAIEAEKKFAFARENTAKMGALIAWRALVTDIRDQYLEAVIAKARITLLEKRVEAAKKRAELTEQEFKLGRIVAMERSAVLLELREKELQLSRNKITLASLLTKLRELSGSDSLAVETLPDDLPEVNWEDDALREKFGAFEKLGLEDSPEIRQSKFAAESFQNQRVMAEARELPSFNLGASMTQTPIERNGGFGMQTYLFAGLMGSWNIFDRDTTRENVRALQLAERLVETKRAYGTKLRLTNLDNALHELSSARQARNLREDLVQLRRDTFDAIRQRASLGLADNKELFAAEDALLSARLDLLKDRAAILKAYHAFMAGILLSPTDQYYTAPTNDR